MASIDLYEDYNEEDDARYGDQEQSDNEENNQIGSDQENAIQSNVNADDDKQEVDASIKLKKPKRKLVTLNAERLKGPRGIIAIDDFFEDIKLKGKGYEKEDLNQVMKRLEHWSHRMFPKYDLDDSLSKIERLGRKKEVAFHMTRYRMGQLTKDDENKVQSDNEDNQMEDSLAHELPVDEFEDMLNQQIALSTTAHRQTNSTSKNDSTIINLNLSGVSTSTQVYKQSTSSQQQNNLSSDDIFSQLKNSQPQKPQLTDEQKARIEENKRRAMEIRAAKLKEIEEKRLKEAEEKKLKELEEKKAEIIERTINIEIDDDFC